MKFVLIDKITELKAGESLKAVKNVSLAEEYLADHFPDFPVLPGVMMIEALTQAAAMLVHVSSDFSHSMVVLAEVKNAKYKSFVKPGNSLEISITAKTIGQQTSSFLAEGSCQGRSMVEARLELRHFNLADKDSKLADIDAKLKDEFRRRYKLMSL
ncbi:MAG: beta-hydroxyacyl-ACP dehydratase [Sedimentisphaerales bacterium]|nr:beta-hydroxyacyl-ACP dehydratase [Sedimentisphaerales bacterium]MBN2842334.1 beta-hydroxyacyl-ACP dehydratase [Sedimentisphaerales bacterium]